MKRTGDNRMNQSSRNKLFIALVVLIAFCLMLVLVYMVIAQNNKNIESTSWSDFISKVNQTMDKNNTRIVWHNEIKTTNGIPFFENDIYNNMEAAPKIGKIFYNSYNDAWEYSICVAGITSARVNNTSNFTNICKSQSLIMDWPQDQGFGAAYTPAFTVTASLPSSNSLDDHYKPAILNSTFIKFRWDYSSWPIGDKSDCGYLVFINIGMGPGTGNDKYFNLTNTASYGLFDSSQTTLHFKIKALPNPENLQEGELQKYGIHNDSRYYSGYYVYADQAIEVT